MLNKKISIWFMRQAGRYLPEYRSISEKFSFFEMSENPEIATEITLQPIKRFDLDAAILFSDILTLPKALGCKIDIKKIEGPVIERISSSNDLTYNNFEKNIQSTLDAIKLVRTKLDNEKTLIGFAGGPWTVASYIIEGGWTKTFLKVRKFINENRDEFKKIINFITDATIKYLSKQIESGADVVKIFDSFAGIPSFEEFDEFIIKPTKLIVDSLNSLNKPVIGFPKGAGTSYVEYAKNTKVDIIATDYTVSVDWIKDNLQEIAIVQGNLDPYLLAFNKEGAVLQTRKIIEKLGSKNFIFNLGHGIFKETPLENVEAIIAEVNKHRK